MATSNFKKLALLGMAGGMLISSQAEVQAVSKVPSGGNSGALVGRSADCRSSNNALGMSESGCNSQPSRPDSAGCNTRRAAQPSYESHGCGGKQASPGNSGCNNNRPSQGLSDNHGCGGKRTNTPSNISYNDRPSQGNNNHGCGGKRANTPNNTSNNDRPSQEWNSGHGCGGKPSNTPLSAGCNGRASQGLNDNHSCGGKRAGISATAGYYESNIVDNYEDAQKSGKVMSENDLLTKLSQDGKNLYGTLDPAAKTMALKLASQECKGKNECKGLNSCKSQHNECAGKAGCQGQSVGPFKNKDDAVKLAAKKMAKKRALMNASQ